MMARSIGDNIAKKDKMILQTVSKAFISAGL